MTNRIDNLVQMIDTSAFNIMSTLEDKVVSKNDRIARISLAGWCQVYGLTAEEFIEWCEEF